MALNSQIVAYISMHKLQKTRYEIDNYLLQNGYDPPEIDSAWLACESHNRNPRFVKLANLILISPFILGIVSGLISFVWAMILLFSSFGYIDRGYWNSEINGALPAGICWMFVAILGILGGIISRNHTRKARIILLIAGALSSVVAADNMIMMMVSVTLLLTIFLTLFSNNPQNP